jgi:hypothetical protein
VRRKGRKFYDSALAVVSGVIETWDPYALIRSGAPRDEFDSESRSVVRQISRIRPVLLLATIILAGCGRYFAPDINLPRYASEKELVGRWSILPSRRFGLGAHSLGVRVLCGAQPKR